MLALSGKLGVVTGGPGTGKTLVAAAVVRGFARRGIAQIALAAPTGKAANRLTEVIGAQLGAAAPVAQTLHRLLGYRAGGFAHAAQSPLPLGALIVDEASMIDLELMDALLDARPAGVPLVLIGDRHQLPAIDAGQILADLVDLRRRRGDLASPCSTTATAWTLAIRAAARSSRRRGRSAPAMRGADVARSARSRSRARRGRSRSAASSGSTRPARPGRSTTTAVATTLWHHFEGPRALRLANASVFRFDDGRVEPAQSGELEQLWSLLARARILTVTRGLPTGSIAINAHLHGLALDRLSVTGRPDFVPGEPVMITANDYQRGLFNGDQGIIVRADEGHGQRFRAVFRVGGELVPFAIEALRDRLELAWALTVHKAQGSELDAVAVILPPDDLPLLTRELVYTAITRARTSVVLCGSRAALIAGRQAHGAAPLRARDPDARYAVPMSGPRPPAGYGDPSCAHVERIEGVCSACGQCAHDVILNGACFLCGTTELDPIAQSPKLISAEQLNRKK